MLLLLICGEKVLILMAVAVRRLRNYYKDAFNMKIINSFLFKSPFLAMVKEIQKRLSSFLSSSNWCRVMKKHFHFGNINWFEVYLVDLRGHFERGV